MEQHTEGYELGKRMLTAIPKELTKVCVAFATGGFLIDGHVKGLVAALKEGGLVVSVVHIWNEIQTLPYASLTPKEACIAPITRILEDGTIENSDVLIMVSGYLDDVTALKTNITRLFPTVNPSIIYIAAQDFAPNAQKELEAEFPQRISEKFAYISEGT